MNLRANILFVFAAWLFGAISASAENSVDFNRDIRPILSKHCFACHGPDEESREADLSLHTADGAKRDLGGHYAINPNDLASSEILTRINSNDPDKVMPPPDSSQTLSTEEKHKLEAWIRDGAEYKVHWSFVPPIKSSLPDVAVGKWPRHEIDYFVLAQLEANKLKPTQESDRYRLLRRVSLDLTGLPPTLEQTEAFIEDQSDKALEKVVDRLLDSDAYGEHWARLWLDLARYADTKGYEKDRPREIWRYRDWVIDAFNADMPFDEFTVEQLAGDLLPVPTSDQFLATAFHRNTMTNEEGGTDDEEFRVKAVKDRVDTTLQVWMGLTMGCAKCHSHKFDPISHSDYYSFYAFFNQTQDQDRGDESPTMRTPTRAEAERIALMKQEAIELSANEQHADASYGFAALSDFEKSIQTTPVMRELGTGAQRETKIHKRGNFLDPGDPVPAQVLELFGVLPTDAPNNRLGVAHWIVAEENPLTARVMVNRIWSRLFGIGLVETEEDFGSQGTAPTHPELLDWLAVDFREQGWSVKQLLRTIVLSSTYRQAGVVSPKKLEADPLNRLISRGPRFRLSAEMVRDQALAISGLLTKKIGGPSVMPPQPAGVWRSTYSTLSWNDETGPDRYRRGLYTYWKRTSPYPAMTTFDAGSGEVCQIRRVRTNTPLQALVTLNDKAFIEAAGALAYRMATAGGDLSAQIEQGFRLTLTRPPSAKELQRLVELHTEFDQEFASDAKAAKELIEAGGSSGSDAAMIAVANVLLNLDETLMKP